MSTLSTPNEGGSFTLDTVYTLPFDSYVKLTGRNDCPKCGGAIFFAEYNEAHDTISITCLTCKCTQIELPLDNPSKGASFWSKRCALCGAYFQAKHGRSIYCSKACVQKAWRQRKKKASS